MPVRCATGHTAAPAHPCPVPGPRSADRYAVNKMGVTKQSHIICPDFKWQPRYHDHIIRNDAEYQRINDYIENNPANWGMDKFHTI
jgi:hypothetical protein